MRREAAGSRGSGHTEPGPARPAARSAGNAAAAARNARRTIRTATARATRGTRRIGRAGRDRPPRSGAGTWLVNILVAFHGRGATHHRSGRRATLGARGAYALALAARGGGPPDG